MQAATETPEKTCSRCGEVRPLNAFNRYRKSQDGRQNYCRDCQRAYRQAPERMAAERARAKTQERKAYQLARAKTPAGRAAQNRRAATYRERHAEDLAEKRQTPEWKAYQRKWRQEHREAIRAYRYVYVRTPKYREAQRVRNQTPERKAWRREYSRGYRQNPKYRERLLAYHRVYDWACRKTDKRKEYERAWRRSSKRQAYELARRQDPEYKAYMRNYSRSYGQRPERKAAREAQRRTTRYKELARTRAHRRRTLGDIPAGWWETRMAVQEGRCCYCDKPFNQTSRKATIEHIVPVSRGGTNDIGNLAIACKRCNSRRGNRRVLAPVSGLLVL